MLALLVGGHWGMLQVVAWTGMVITYSRDASLGEAVRKTFDGDHPCALCNEVSAGLAGMGEGVDPEAADQWPDKAPDKAPNKASKTMQVYGLTNGVLVTPTATPVIAKLGQPAHRALSGITVGPLRRPPRNVG